MDINVSQLLKSPVGTTREYNFDPGERLRLDAEIVAVIDDGHVRLDRVNTGILARGQTTALVNLLCARCLEPVDIATHVEFAEQFAPSIDMSTGKPLPPPDDELTFLISQNHMLDLNEALRQNLLAALPIQAVCKPDCAGLCPKCGTNRNVGACDCIVDDANHPFAALAELLKDGVSPRT